MPILSSASPSRTDPHLTGHAAHKSQGIADAIQSLARNLLSRVRNGSVCGTNSGTKPLIPGTSADQATHFKLVLISAAAETLAGLERAVPPLPASYAQEIRTHLNHYADKLRTSKFKRQADGEPGQLKKAMGGKYKKSRLLDLKGLFRQEQETWVNQGVKNQPLPGHTSQMHFRTGLASYLRGQLLRVGVHEYTIHALDQMIFQEYVNLLNRQPWGPISSSVSLSAKINGLSPRWTSFQSRQTPAALLDGALAFSYRRDGLHGICSYSTREHRHAVNLWKTEFEPAGSHDVTEPGHFQFTGLRHGVHDAYQIKSTTDDGVDRDTANDMRVAEFVHAALRVQMDRGTLQAVMDGDKPVIQLNVLSVNLLTPVGKESKMIEKQTSAFRRAEQNGVVLNLRDQNGLLTPVLVKPRFIAFNTPVNAFSFSRAGKMMGITRASDEMNRSALKALIGSTTPSAAIGGVAGDHLNQLRQELESVSDMTLWKQKKQAIVSLEGLIEQVRSIWQNKLHHSVGNEPYKLPVRLLAIANACNVVPAFNCKSGKDRTGQLNVEIRDFYAHLGMHDGKLRPVDEKRTGLAKANYQKLFEASGDREIQALNTGVSGSKAQLNIYNKLMDTPNATINRVKGLSRWVGS